MSTYDLHDEYRRLRDAYDETERLLTLPDAQLFAANEAVSRWSPAQQLYHLWLVAGRMLKAARLLHHGGGTHEGELNRIGRMVLESGRFIRGRAGAPAETRPPDDLTRQDLEASLVRSRRAFAEVEPLLDDLPALEGRLPHPIFGALRAGEWLRNARVHTEHHLGIIRDILGETKDIEG